MKNFLLSHTFCFATNTVLKTDKSIDEVNKIIYLIQSIECDLPSVDSCGDGIYQDDLKIILSEFFKLDTEEYLNQSIDYQINILDNWEYSGNSSYENRVELVKRLRALNKQGRKELNNKLEQELYKIAYKEGLELYLIDFRLNQIRNKDSKDFKIFTDIKNAVVNKDETFYWSGWCGRSVEKTNINYKDFLNLK